MAAEKLDLWNSVNKTDPAHTKQFSRGGGFKGTAISPMYLIHKATERWGPMGSAWGIRIVEDKIIEGAPLLNGEGVKVGNEAVHVVQAEVFFPVDDEIPGRGYIPCFGQTTFVGRNKNGFFTDEEAPKKSLTDALTKGLSWLGFAADVHMGLYDDNKYVNAVREDLAKKKDKPPAKSTPFDDALKSLAAVGVTREAFIKVLKEKGFAGYQHSRDASLVLAMIEEARENMAFNQDIHAGEPV